MDDKTKRGLENFNKLLSQVPEQAQAALWADVRAPGYQERVAERARLRSQVEADAMKFKFMREMQMMGYSPKTSF